MRRHHPAPPVRARSAVCLVMLAVAACTDAPATIAGPELASGRAAFDPPLATLDWQQQARSLVALNRLPVLAAERVYSYLSIGQYAALTRADGATGTSAGNGFGSGGRASFERTRGAITGVSAQVLAYFFPNQAGMLQQLTQAEAESRGSTHPAFTAGVQVGAEVAQAMIARAMEDRFTTPFTGTMPSGPGIFVPVGTPLGITGAGVMPWVLNAPDQFRSPPPPPFGSEAFLVDLAEVRAISDARTEEQLAIARYWAFQGATFTPAGHWNQLAAQYVAEAGLGERDAAHVLALMHAAQFDSNVIACSDSKYAYWYLRPYEADPQITSPLGKPNHPSYPAGHSCAASAATTVLAYFFPERQAELTAMRVEAGLSRMYAGFHYRFDITAGVQLGTSIGLWAIALDESQGLLSRLN